MKIEIIEKKLGEDEIFILSYNGNIFSDHSVFINTKIIFKS